MEDIRGKVQEALLELPTRIGFFPTAGLSVEAGAATGTTFRRTGIDKGALVVPAMTREPEYVHRWLIRGASAHAVGLAWKPYFALPRRRVAVRSLAQFFAASSRAAVPIKARGARAICLLPVGGPDWVETLNPFDVARHFGAAYERREFDVLKSYCFTIDGIDFHRSAGRGLRKRYAHAYSSARRRHG